MKRIETRDNEVLTQFRQSLKDSFPSALDMRVDYYLGEEDDKQQLCFSLTSRFGKIYSNTKVLQRGQLVSDVEEEFMNILINDLILNGITFLNNLAFESISPDRVNKEIRAKLFRHSTPRKFLYIN